MIIEPSPASVLLHLYRVGATVSIVGDQLEVGAPDGVLTPEIHHVLAARKARLFDLLAFAGEYRAVLRSAFAHGTSGSAVSPEDARELLDEQTRLIDELGPALAAQIYEMTDRHQEPSIHGWDDATGTSRDSIDSE